MSLGGTIVSKPTGPLQVTLARVFMAGNGEVGIANAHLHALTAFLCRRFGVFMLYTDTVTPWNFETYCQCDQHAHDEPPFPTAALDSF